MAESGSLSLGFQFDINQILLEAQHRWLRPAEICEILRNYQKFRVSPEAPNNPVSGSTFLFDRKVLRYFRKDGHNWRKKKDGKTVKEAHEKLKVGSIDMLHCYYAHGEDNENFQRRSYWLLQPDLMHIVFVHYLEVQGGKLHTNHARNTDILSAKSENDSMFSPTFHGASPTSTLSSANEDAESEDNHQANSRFHPHLESPLCDDNHSGLSTSYGLLSSTGNWDVSSPNYATHFQGRRDVDSGGSKFLSRFQPTNDLAAGQEALIIHTAGELTDKKESVCYVPVQANMEENSVDRFYNHSGEHKNQSEQRKLQAVLTEMEIRSAGNPNLEIAKDTAGNENYSFLVKKPLINSLQKDESLKKVDSFTRWMAKELGDADELDMLSSNRLSWSDYDSSISAQLEVDADSLSSILGDQLFSITDFSPNWTYSNWECKVVITGKFLKSEIELSECKWSIMFGEIEIPADVLADGILCSHAPLHKPGLVPFYVTCSNRLACSEIREFEYRRGHNQNIGAADINERAVTVMHLYRRLEMLLCQRPIGSPIGFIGDDLEKQTLMQKILSLVENCHDAKLPQKNCTSRLMVTDEVLLEKHLKEKFSYWLLQRIYEDTIPIVVDDRGQCVQHLAAALGLNWVFQPISIPGVSLDFRDVNGWTALHWAAFHGREDTVAALVSLGAAPGALTDPSAEYPLGRTPADLASSSGHKGISGFLAETSLTTHLATLGMNDRDEVVMPEVPGMNAIHTVSERLAVPTTEEEVSDTLSLKDSLAAVCNASQAAARIHQIFRIQSFQRKQFAEQGVDEFLSSDEHAISLVAGKSSRLGRSDGLTVAAAVHIQKKFRGWKKRKEFLQIRQKVVKIQAHVRGHQARKKQKSIMWPVGILEKVILRWRRKGRGFRGFRSDGVQDGPNVHGTKSSEDNYDVLKEGRKQTEERMQKALARVKSMAQYPEARAQYRRLLTAAEGFRETKASSDVIPDNIEDIGYVDDEMLDIESLLDDDVFMSLAFQ